MSAVNHTYAAATDAAGTGLFASKDVAAGELILRLNAEEIYSVLDVKNLDRACENCFLLLEAPEDAEEISLMKCSGCERVKYCGQVSIAFDRRLRFRAYCWKKWQSPTDAP
jgi:hypothetical protein